jgi:HAMP domain-containing protein
MTTAAPFATEPRYGLGGFFEGGEWMAEVKKATGPAAGKPRGGTALAGSEWLLDAQREWLAALEMAMTGWLNRRQEALSQAKQSFDDMPQCRSLADVLGLQQQWLAASFERLAADLTAWSEATMLLSRIAMKQVEEGSRVALSTGREAEPMLQAAGDKPSTPPRAS